MGDYGDTNPLIHKVTVPQLTLKEETILTLKPVRDLLVEDEDPFRDYRGKSGLQKTWITLCYWFPIFEWLSTYKTDYLFGDIIGGLTIASLAVPQDLAYAKLANLPPINGLYSSFTPPLIYAVLGSSKHIAIGPVSVVSSLLGNLLTDYLDPTLPDPTGAIDKKTNKVKQITNQDYVDLAITATFFAGIIQLGMGLLRLGFVIDFLSHAAVVGFMAGAAITIAGGQLKGMLGYETFTTEPKVQEILRSIFSHTNEFQWRTFLVGFAFLVYLVVLKIALYWNKKNRTLFYLNATGPLFTVVVATLAVWLSKVDENYALKVVGDIKKGVNPSSLHQIRFDGDFKTRGWQVGVVAGLVALTEAVAIGRTFAAMEGYHIDGNKEMVALGASNLVGSMTSCYVVTGSFSRSAVNHVAGTKTAMSNIVMALVVLFTLVLVTPLFKHLPNAALSAIIISALVGLIDFPGMYRIWKSDKLDFITMLGAFFGVLFISIEMGLLIAVIISAFKILLQAARPHMAVLGRIPGTNVYRNVTQYPNAETTTGILVLRIDASIYFANANYLREKVERLADRHKDNEKLGALKFVILELTPVSDIDTTGVHALDELHTALKKKGFTLGLSNPPQPVLWKLHSSGFVETLGEENLFLSVNEGVKIFTALLEKNVDGDGLAV